MIIYHGSNMTVQKPKILTPNRYLDFGAGFYTTTNYDQALNFAGKVTVRKKYGRSTVNVYELDESIFDKAKVLNFECADEQKRLQGIQMQGRQMCKLSETGGMFKCETGKKELTPTCMGRLQGYGV